MVAPSAAKAGGAPAAGGAATPARASASSASATTVAAAAPTPSRYEFVPAPAARASSRPVARSKTATVVLVEPPSTPQMSGILWLSAWPETDSAPAKVEFHSRNFNSAMPACSACAAPALLACSACAAPYCSAACQRAAWPGHRGACRAAAAARAVTAAAVTRAALVASAARAAAAAAAARPIVFAQNLTACSHCSAPFAGVRFFECAPCRTVAYCGAACQRAAWVGGHKAACRAAGAAKFAADMALAEAGNNVAMFNIALYYKDGMGVATDMREAAKWSLRAAEAGNTGAQFNLGTCYTNGTGVAADAREAFKWYTRAAEAGNADAQCNLGACYADGEGVAADFTAARNWLSLAAAAGIEEAAASLERLGALEAAP